ncbi:MAG: BamA/TamA family outer membrane protein [Bacteroidota bacterium]
MRANLLREYALCHSVKAVIFFGLIGVLISCTTQQPLVNNDHQYPNGEVQPQGEVDHTVFVVGNMSLGQPSRSKELESYLKANLEAQSNKSTVIVLGADLPADDEEDTVINAETDHKMGFLRSIKNSLYITPGLRDWGNGNSKGHEQILENQQRLEKIFESDLVFFPKQGCPGPEEIPLSDDLVLLIIDTQWWLHQWNKPIEGGCELVEESDFFIQLHDAIQRNHDKKILVAGFHPMYSSGPHGGAMGAGTHLLPPVLGSLYYGYRKWIGNPQDLVNQRYKQLINGLESVFKQHQQIVYLSAHDRTLEYHERNGIRQVVSGSFSGTDRIDRKAKAAYAFGKEGLARLNFYKNGEVWLEFVVAGMTKTLGSNVAYRTKVLAQPAMTPQKEDSIFSTLDYTDKTATAAASDFFNTDKQFRLKVLGQNYRTEWGHALEDIRYFDLDKEKGGMRIVKRGGGQQTKSLRLEDKNGKQYVLRSIEKFPEKATPEALRGTIAADVVADEISSSHPYGALAIPKLADAAKVWHTNPELVYLPDDPRLGQYRSDFGGSIYLYEERPAKNRDDVASFGRSKKIISTFDLLDKLEDNDKHYVDQEQVVRSRLFDIWIGDWDRHEDQWRWARFKDKDDYNRYQPIPRDRDQAFFYSDGSLMKLGSHKWGIPKFQGFHEDIRDVAGLNFNARFFDRTFMNEPTMDAWLSIAKELQNSLKDEIIESAVKDLPPEIYASSGETIITKLKARRGKLLKYAREYYLFLAKTVTVVGTEENDRFRVQRLNDQETRVRVYRKRKGKDRKMYDRVFKTGETKEIRLYGRDGKDDFEVSGSVSNGILVRMIGGKGKDDFVDSSAVKGWRKKSIIYDKKKKTDISAANETALKLSDDKSINAYNRSDFQYDITAPAFFFGFNPDDGLFLGGGTIITTHGFRKTPFKQRHRIVANIAPGTSSYNIIYNGEFTEALGKWDLLLDADLRIPSFTDFFYGFGNETIIDETKRELDRGFYRTRLRQIDLQPGIRRRWNDDRHTLSLGARLWSVELSTKDMDEPRFINDFDSLRSVNEGTSAFDVMRFYTGFYANYTFDSRDSRAIPTRGLVFNVSANAVRDIDQESFEVGYQQIKSDVSWFLGFGRGIKTVLALRLGGALNTTDDFEFYQSNTLGGLNNLRGFRRMRFSGRYSIYQNSELRFKLTDFRSRLFGGAFGVLAIHDFGRVWFPGENSSQIQQGYGGGIWIAPLNAAVISFDYTRSNTGENGVYLRFGFLF